MRWIGIGQQCPPLLGRVAQARRKRGGGAGRLQRPNNLLKFLDFVSEKGCDCQSRGNEDLNSYIFKEATKNAISFDVIQLESFELSWKYSHQF